MNLLEREIPTSIIRWEGLIICMLAWGGFAAIPLTLGEIGISWDALNHHIYLGWTAEHPRFDRDLLAAGYQSFQFPYLYWPVYKLATSGWPGEWAGFVLATLHLIAVPPVWMLAKTCMPGNTAFDAVMRLLAVALAFMTGVVLSLFDSTSNDLLAAAPLVWAIALGLAPLDKARQSWLNPSRAAILSGLCAGLAVACKLSNGPLALILPFTWLMSASSVRNSCHQVLRGSLATIVGFASAYGYWGSLLWVNFGNPIYPFADSWFSSLRSMTGWTP